MVSKQNCKALQIVCISDTHNRHLEFGQLPEGDILIHAGDWSNQGTEEEEKSFREFFSNQPHPHKIFINGNHERVIAGRDKAEIQQRFPDCYYLEDESITIEGAKIYGTPWCDMGKYFARGDDAVARWAGIPDDVDILVTHLPPSGILDLAHEPFISRSSAPGPPPECFQVPKDVLKGDRVNLMAAIRSTKPVEEDPTRKQCEICDTVHPDRQHWGGPELRERVQQIGPAVHIFGHVHEQAGFEIRDQTMYLNAACEDPTLGAFIFTMTQRDDQTWAIATHPQRVCLSADSA